MTTIGSTSSPYPQALAIAELPPELQNLIRAREAEFSEGAKDQIDTQGELRRLLEVLGQEGAALPGNPGNDTLKGLDQQQLMQMLVDWLTQNGQLPGSNNGQNLGKMGNSCFANGRSGGNNCGWGAKAPTGTTVRSDARAEGTPNVGSLRNLSPEQKANARIIVEEGRKAGASERDIQIGLMTAMQESGLRNLNGGDRDSAGLFQQRPSCGWGSQAQVTDPHYAARTFFLGTNGNAGLLSIRNRDQMSLTQAAQTVQRSAFPNAYAKHEGVARALLDEVGNA